MPPNVAMVGAGSIGFTRKLVQDILTVPELSINRNNLEMVCRLTLGFAGPLLPAKTWRGAVRIKAKS